MPDVAANKLVFVDLALVFLDAALLVFFLVAFFAAVFFVVVFFVVALAELDVVLMASTSTLAAPGVGSSVQAQTPLMSAQACPTLAVP